MTYDIEKYALLPHDPMEATVDELVANHLAWIGGDIGKKYVLASSKNKLDSKHEE